LQHTVFMSGSCGLGGIDLFCLSCLLVALSGLDAICAAQIVKAELRALSIRDLDDSERLEVQPCGALKPGLVPS
jgi:hypothetical protein